VYLYFTNSRGRRELFLRTTRSTRVRQLSAGHAINISRQQRTDPRNTADTAASKETRYTNPVRRREKIISRYVLQFTRRERDVPKDPWESRYYDRSSLRSRPGARLGYFRDSAYGPK